MQSKVHQFFNPNPKFKVLSHHHLVLTRSHRALLFQQIKRVSSQHSSQSLPTTLGDEHVMVLTLKLFPYDGVCDRAESRIRILLPRSVFLPSSHLPWLEM